MALGPPQLGLTLCWGSNLADWPYLAPLHAMQRMIALVLACPRLASAKVLSCLKQTDSSGLAKVLSCLRQTDSLALAD